VSRLLILVAVELEARGLARKLGLRRRAPGPWSHFAAGRIEIRVVGLRAAGLSTWDLGDDVDLVVSAGSCGALVPALSRAGALVLPEIVLPPDGPALTVDRAGHARALAAAAHAGLVPATGPLATVQDVVDTPEAKAALARRTGALAVDMESAAIVAAAQRRGLAAIVVRGVSDTADQPVPRELAALAAAGTQPRPAQAARVVLRRPALLREAWALWRGTRLALDTVATILGGLGDAD
jgi:adenosylhomocysteine nucleosidase